MEYSIKDTDTEVSIILGTDWINLSKIAGDTGKGKFKQTAHGYFNPEPMYGYK